MERKEFGYLCSYWPEELTLALGLETVRILPEDTTLDTPRLPAYTCSYAKHLTAMAESGRLNQLAGIGFSHTCDTMQCLPGIWQSPGNLSPPVFMHVPPVVMDNADAREYYRQELVHLWERLCRAYAQESNPEALLAAIKLKNRVRRKIQQLAAQLQSSAGFAGLLRKAQTMPPSLFLEKCDGLVAEARAEAPPVSARRLLLTGAVLENNSLFAAIEELGGHVAFDDTCTGLRHFAGQVAETGDPFANLADYYSSRPPCPCRHASLLAREEYLLGAAGEHNVDGIIILLRKYCDPHAWDAVDLRQGLAGHGYPVLVLELEGAKPGEQERTRLQAFLENLAARRDTGE